LAATLLCAPRSRMDILTNDELNNKINASKLVGKYSEVIDRESAYEILNKKLETSREFDLQVPDSGKYKYEPQPSGKTSTRTRTEKSTVDKVINSPLSKQIGRTLAREISRGILGVLGFGGRKR
ncbi:MAG TPA: helicase HerA-like domain-containing protein, partial [Ignavibacteriaceae bacterium]